MTILTMHGEFFTNGKNDPIRELNGKGPSGYYAAMPGSVLFYTETDKLFAAYVENSSGFKGLVTASTVNNGRPRYMHGLCSLDAARFGLDVMNDRAIRSFEKSLSPFVK